MSADESAEDEQNDPDPTETEAGAGPVGVRERLERETDRARERFDESVIGLLSWALDTETRARVYVYLRGTPESTSDEIAEGTGLYPDTVRETLVDLRADGQVTRTRRRGEAAEDGPYEYSALPPSELVSERVSGVQSRLDAALGLDGPGSDEDPEPVTITVREEHERSRSGGDEDERGDAVDDG